MMKFFIKNRKKQKVCVLVEEKKKARGLVFVMHGLGSFKEATTVQSRADVFSEAGFTVVRFDTTNALGESDGRYEDATFTNYYSDLEDVIGWSKKQSWYQEPFVLVGSSLGGFCVAYYAEKHSNKVKALVSIAPVVSGELRVRAHQKYDSEKFRQWKKTGWYTRESVSKPGTILNLPWSHVADSLKYDLLPKASKLSMPVLVIVGEKDTSTPVDQVKLFFKVLPGSKELHVLNGVGHVFRNKKHIVKSQNILRRWIEKSGIAERQQVLVFGLDGNVLDNYNIKAFCAGIAMQKNAERLFGISKSVDFFKRIYVETSGMNFIDQVREGFVKIVGKSKITVRTLDNTEKDFRAGLSRAENSVKMFSDVRQFLYNYSRAYKYVITTTVPINRIQAIVKKHGLNKYFSLICARGGVWHNGDTKLIDGFDKGKKHFDYILNFFKIDKHNLVTISSTKADIVNAAEYGLTAVAIERIYKKLFLLKSHPNYVLKDMSGLRGVLQKLK